MATITIENQDLLARLQDISDRTKLTIDEVVELVLGQTTSLEAVEMLLDDHEDTPLSGNP